MQKLLFLFVLICGSVTLNAQNAFGVKAGANFSYLADIIDDGSSSQDVNDLLIAYHLGVFYELSSTGTFGFRAELLWSVKGEKDELATLSSLENLTYSYLSLPLLLIVRPVEILNVEVGAEPGYAVATSNEFLEPDQPLEIGGIIGVSGNLMDGQLLVGARLVWGFTDVFSVTITDQNGDVIGESSIQNRTIQLWAGYKF